MLYRVFKESDGFYIMGNKFEVDNFLPFCYKNKNDAVNYCNYLNGFMKKITIQKTFLKNSKIKNELNKKLDIIQEKIKNLGDPITFNDVSKVRKLDKKANLLKIDIKILEAIK